MSTTEDWGRYLAVGVAPRRRLLIGGNWKCNGTLKEVKTLVDRLNTAPRFPLTSEVRFFCFRKLCSVNNNYFIQVVIAVPNLHLLSVQATVREDISVSAQVTL